MPPVPPPLTDAQVDEQLRRILDEVEALQQRWAAGELTPAVQPGSSLAGDDAKTRPYELSHAVTHTTAIAAWQVCSGFAHGRTWSSLSLLEREVVAHPQPGVVLLSLTNRLGAVLWATWAAFELVGATLALFTQRAASPHGPG